MFSMIWPIALVVLSNTLYNICAKSTPANANAFLSLAVSYLAAAGLSILAFLLGDRQASLAVELRRLNWTSIVLAFSIIGLEFGYICVYRAGWKVNTASLVGNIVLACVLVGVGALLYHEGVSLRQIAGIAACMVGLVLLGL